MKKSAVLAAVVLFSAASLAYPGLTGGRGLLRVQDARCEGNWNASLMLQGIAGSYSYKQVPDAWRIGMAPDTRLNAYDLTAIVGVSPIEWFELFCWSGGTLEKWRWEESDSVFSGYHDLVPGAKLSIPVFPVVKLGALGAYSMYPNFGDSRGGWALGRFGLPFVNGLAWSGLLTLDLQEVTAFPSLYLNYGQAYDSDEGDQGTTQTTYSTFGAALEHELDKLDLFVEFVSVQTDGAPPFASAGKMYVTPGIKVGYAKPLVVEGGVSVGLTDNVPDFEFVVGLGLSGRLFTPSKPTTGVVAGKVVDVASGKALVASVEFPGEPQSLQVNTDAVKGTFAAKRIRAGTVRVKASAPGYVPVEQDVKVTAGKTSKADFALELEETTGSIAGRVTDPTSNAAIAAKVSVNGGAPQPTDADGRFRFDDVAAGEHKVEATADGYLTASSDVRVAAREETRADFQLVRAGVKITLRVYFDFDKAALKPESHDALAAAAKIMKENPAVRVEIQGHTDNVGSVAYNDGLSMRRAQAVVDYLVGELGIDAGRLAPRGFGLAKPVVSNDTDQGRAQNRRVEFLVLGEQ